MPPSGECPPHIALAAAMVNEFVETTQNTNKTQLLASNYSTFWSLVVCKNLVTQIEPSTHRIDAPSFIKMWNATIKTAELSYISSYQTLLGHKNWKHY